MAKAPEVSACDKLHDLLEEPLWVAIRKLKNNDVERIEAIARLISYLANPRLTPAEVTQIANDTLGDVIRLLFGEFHIGELRVKVSTAVEVREGNAPKKGRV